MLRTEPNTLKMHLIFTLAYIFIERQRKESCCAFHFQHCYFRRQGKFRLYGAHLARKRLENIVEFLVFGELCALLYTL